MNRLTYQLAALLLVISTWAYGQTQYELNSGWQCSPIGKTKDQGTAISVPSYALTGWQPAVVPGTVLTTMLANKQVPDPFYGMNNNKIPDIFNTGRDYYTYWFVKDFQESNKAGEQVWLNFRGINYSCDVFLNGHKLNSKPYTGMFLRKSFNVTPFLQKDGKNRLAVIVYPPDPVGNPNGGQGGDGTIARNVAHQYVAGWDWIQPIRDRNTGIWDKVTIEKTGAVNVKNPHVVTSVPGIRQPEGAQKTATVTVSAELENASATKQEGTLTYTMNGQTVTKKVSLPPRTTTTIELPVLTVANPKLWWPSGYGEQHLYPASVKFQTGAKTVSDEEKLIVGIREIQTEWNTTTRSRQILVNGQKVFIKGANWIISDAMLRFTPERYDAEMRYHRDMNLNLIRIWGGALTERPEFYQACDKYGLLVMQDFWGSGDCNGRWVDPMKKDDQWTRRKYPDDHSLFLTSAADQIKMIRNHASLAMWCGGNEITLPQDIMNPLRDSILPKLDGTRWFIDYSNSDEMSYNFLGGNGDGPYGIQPISKFWSYRTWPFNSEVGSVGVSDYTSLERFIPKENMVVPVFKNNKSEVDSVWDYHKYIGYDASIDPYGKAKDVRDFAKKAQLVNYDQYRALMEGFSSHMWDWYTGTIIWKTQNPWTAMRGQMYDYYLDPNAGLYGLHSGSEPLHIMYNPIDSMVMVVNNTFKFHRDMMMVVKLYDMDGKETTLTQVFSEIGPSLVRPYVPIGRALKQLTKDKGGFLVLQLLDLDKKPISENTYWLPDAKGEHSGLQQIAKAPLQLKARQAGKGKVEVTLTNPAGGPVAFFNRLSLVDSQTKTRLLPVFYSDNYVTVAPGQQKTITMEYTPTTSGTTMVSLEGWNVADQFVPVN
ncbi:glycoside hydrolase family 2 protein [Spirosoma sp. KUDC1026]|uniref:glycoside hydrolase family 2 protein n=1 Tax=Spirosoma sp. KUDC1026 TaxID=2745947 RepID=UPI00159BC992|nr:glycoside hydrolase family 2 TIM barrel-domain containing protein [Spirosoma sp. KUDC1026]QKZ12140.1 glycosyl hydrolase [Spirosoma sp. KUDC1026]